MRLLVFLFFLTFVNVNNFAQKNNVNLTIKGWVKDFTTKQNIFGSTVYMIQNGSVVGKSVSERNGLFTINGPIDPSLTFEILSSKPGFASKKILINLTNYKKPSRKVVEVILQFSDQNGNQSGELEFTLYKKLDTEDFSFSKKEYAERFNWDESRALVVAEGLNAIMDERAQQLYDDAEKNEIEIDDESDSLQIAKKEEQLKEQIEKSIEKAKQYNDQKNFGAAMIEYKKALQLISNSTNSNALGSFKNQAKNGFEDAKTKKESEDQVFNNQLSIQQKNIKTDRTGLDKAKKFLTSPFMKGRANDPEVLRLENQMNELTAFYQKMDAALSVIDTDTTQGFVMLKKVYQTGVSNSNFTPSNELSKIKNKLDSIEKLLNSKKNKNKENVNSLQSPGTIVKTSKKELLNELKDAKEEIEFSDQRQIQNKIAEVQNINSMEQKLNAAYSEDSQEKINNWKLEKDRIELKIKELNNKENIELSNSLDSLNYLIFKRDSLNNAILSDKSIEFQKVALLLDSLNYNNNNYLDSLSEKTRASVELFLTFKSINNQKIDSLNEINQKIIEDEISKVNLNIYKKDSLNESFLNSKSKEIEKQQLNIDSLNYARDLSLDSLSEATRAKIEKLESNNSITNLVLDSLNEIRQLDNESRVLELESNIFRKDSSELAYKNQKSKEFQELQISNDSIFKNTMKTLEQLQLNHRNNLETFVTEKTMNSEVLDSLSELRRLKSEMVDLDLYIFLSNQNNIKLKEDENRSKVLENDYYARNEEKREPNYLADENGKIYEKDSIHEEVFKIENDYGYVEVVITRRIVVDKIGYGVVYEHRVDANGSSSFSRNGFPITEYQWTSESNNLSLFD